MGEPYHSEETVEPDGNDPFFIYRKLCQIKNFMVLCENKKLTVEIPSKKEHIFLWELPKKCFVKVIKRTKFTAPLRSEYDDEIIFTVIVCGWNYNKPYLKNFILFFNYCSHLLMSVF